MSDPLQCRKELALAQLRIEELEAINRNLAEKLTRATFDNIDLQVRLGDALSELARQAPDVPHEGYPDE